MELEQLKGFELLN